MYNYNKLLGRITELGMTKDDLAKKIGMSRTTLYYKLNCESEFTQEEIQYWISLPRKYLYIFLIQMFRKQNKKEQKKE